MSQQRFRITNAPEALPGSCLICGAATREFFVDTDIHIEFHGRIYLCNECLAEMSRMAGFETPGNVAALLSQKESLEKRVFELTRDNDALERVIDGYSRLGRTSNSTQPPVSSIPGQLSFDSVSSETAQGGTESLGGREGETSEQVDEQGVDDLRTSQSSEFTLDL